MPRNSPTTYLLQTVILFTLVIAGYSGSSHIGTLKKFQSYACDGDTLNVKCPNGTKISVVGATYQKSTNPDYLCLPKTSEDSLNADGDCTSSAAFLTVINACQNKLACKMVASPRTLGEDPCPGVRKLASVEYRCRPHYFKKKFICEDQTIKLKCPRGKRLAIFKAEFGRVQKDNVLECPLPNEMKDKVIKDCQASYATETVLKICHGQKRCVIPATTGTFGDPCLLPNLNLYLSVEFTCVPKEILKDDFKDNTELNGGEDVMSGYDLSGGRHYQGSTFPPNWPMQPPRPSFTNGPGDMTAFPPVVRPTNETDMQSDETGEENGKPKSSSNNTDEVVISSSDTTVVGFVTEWISAYSFIKGNKEKFILYVTLSLSAGIVLLLIVLSVRLYTQKKKKEKNTKISVSQPVPSMFADDASELEHFGSESTDQLDGVEIVRYTNRSTMRRQDSDTNPRAPVSMSLNNYYYS